MEALQLVITFFLATATIVSFAHHYHRRRSNAAARSSLRQPTIKIRDATIARQALIDHADAFSNRPPTPFPVPLITGRRRRSQSHGLTTVPYGPHWRALRSSLTAAMLQPWRRGLLAPLLHDAVAGLVAGLHGEEVVVIRERMYPAVFGMLARVCFGDDVDPGHVKSMERMMLEFTAAIFEAKVFARSPMARLWHWRRWRRFLAFRTQQAALFGPLIAARRRRQGTAQQHGNGAGGLRRPYVDSLIENRSIPGEEDGDGDHRRGAEKPKRGLTEDEMVSLVVEFFGVAEGVVTALEWTLAHLVDRPEIQAKLRRELAAAAADNGGGKNENDEDGGSDDEHHVAGGGDGGGAKRTSYLHAVVLEGLRLHPPFPLVMREVVPPAASSAAVVDVVGAAAAAAAEAGGGMRVQFILEDIGKDGRVWADPKDFRPERFLAGGEGEGVGVVPGGAREIRMMPFGAGQRACPGAGMAVQFIKAFLAALVREFQWSPPPAKGGGGVDMAERYGFIVQMKSPLRARITPAAACK